MTIGLLIVGDEILSGKRADKHFTRVVELLGERGLSLSWARYVGDDPDRITADLKDAFAAAARGEVVFSCGGIGATPDDHTRGCAARALGRPLELHPQARDLILERMRDVAAEQGLPYEPDRARQRARLNMACSRRLRDRAQPLQQDPGFAIRHAAAAGRWRRVLRARLSGDGLAHDRLGARPHYADRQRREPRENAR